MNYLRKNIFKVLYSFITISLFMLPLFYFVSYNFISHNTYEKNYLLVKKGSPSYMDQALMQDEPIINIESLKIFTKEIILSIFQYETAFASDKLEQNKEFFTSNAYYRFKALFDYRAGEEKDEGTVIKDVLITDGPYYMGKYEHLNKTAWQFYAEIKELKHGMSGKTVSNNRDVFIIILEEEFDKNGKGLSIDNIEIL